MIFWIYYVLYIKFKIKKKRKEKEGFINLFVLEVFAVYLNLFLFLTLQ